MTNEAIITEAWTTPRPNATAHRPAATVAVLGHGQSLAARIAVVLDPDDRLHVHEWRDDGDASDGAAIMDELASIDASVVCIGTDVPRHIALDLAAATDRDHPGISIVLIAVPTDDLWRDALRAGVRDVIDPDRIDLELERAIQRAVDRASRVHSQLPATPAPDDERTAGVIVVVSPKGGSGKTMVASNLAAQLARTAEGSVALVDLDVQFGDAATALGLVPERSIGQLATVPTIDSTTLKVFLTPHEPSGAFVLSGTDSPEEGDAVTPDHARRIVDLLAEDFAYVVVDTPAGLDERTLSAVERATDVLFVATMDVSSIRGLGKEIRVLDRLGLLAGRQQHFVLNRADSRVGLELTDVEAALGMSADARLPSSRSVPVSMNQGRPIVIDSPSSPVARELVKLTQRIAGIDDTGRRARLPWRKK